MQRGDKFSLVIFFAVIPLTFGTTLMRNYPSFNQASFSSVSWLISSSGGHEGWFSGELLPVISAGGPCEQFWHRQGSLMLGHYRGSLPISYGVTQGRMLTPTLFSIFYGMMLPEAKEDVSDNIYTRFWTDGNPFNLRRHLTQSKASEELSTELLFIVDLPLPTLQYIVNWISDAAASKQQQQQQQPPQKQQQQQTATTTTTKQHMSLWQKVVEITMGVYGKKIIIKKKLRGGGWGWVCGKRDFAKFDKCQGTVLNFSTIVTQHWGGGGIRS